MLSTPVGRFRFVALLEGVSSVLLFFVAMPIKYVDALGNHPEPTFWVGAVHGGLFVLYAVAGFAALYARRWGVMPAVWGFVASVVPGATFVYDARFLKPEHDRELAGKPFAPEPTHGN